MTHSSVDKNASPRFRRPRPPASVPVVSCLSRGRGARASSRGASRGHQGVLCPAHCRAANAALCGVRRSKRLLCGVRRSKGLEGKELLRHEPWAAGQAAPRRHGAGPWRVGSEPDRSAQRLAHRSTARGGAVQPVARHLAGGEEPNSALNCRRDEAKPRASFALRAPSTRHCLSAMP